MWRHRAKEDRSIQVFAVSLLDIDIALRGKPEVNPAEKLPRQYHEYLDLFSKKNADSLPPHRPGVDHAIEITKGERGEEQEIPWGPLYSMNRNELLLLRKFLTEYLSKGFVRASKSAIASPILLVRKPSGGVRFCVDYRALNKITKKDRYPLPLIQETLDRISKAR